MDNYLINNDFRIYPFSSNTVVYTDADSLRKDLKIEDESLADEIARREKSAEDRRYAGITEAEHLFMLRETTGIIGGFAGEQVLPGQGHPKNVLITTWSAVPDEDIYVRFGGSIALMGQGWSHSDRWVYTWRGDSRHKGFFFAERTLALTDMKRMYELADRFTRTLEGYRMIANAGNVVPSLENNLKLPETKQLNTLISRCGQ